MRVRWSSRAHAVSWALLLSACGPVLPAGVDAGTPVDADPRDAGADADTRSRDAAPDAAERRDDLGAYDASHGAPDQAPADQAPADQAPADQAPADQGADTSLPDGSAQSLPGDLAAQVVAALPAGHTFLLGQAAVDPFANFAGDLLLRRFGVAGFEHARMRFDEATAAAEGGAAATMRLVRRTFEYESPLLVADLHAISARTDLITLPALHCDRVPFPADYDARLRSAEAEGGYGATHVVLGWVWAHDHGCAFPLPPARWVAVVDQLVAMVEPALASDLAYEAAALLYYIGQGFRVPDALVAATLEAQQADGGWDWDPGAGAESNWHSTGLALWFLHERLLGPTFDTMSASPP